LEVALDPWPAWAQRPRPPAAPVTVTAVVPIGERNSTLTSLVGSMRRRGMSTEAILAALVAENAARCIPPLPAAELETIAQSVSRYEPASGRGFTVRALRDVVADVESRGARRFIVAGIIAERSYGVEAAELKAQKSWDAADLGISVASGTPWLDHFAIGVSGPVLIIFNEGDDDELVRRLAALGRSRGIDWRELPIHISVTPPQLLNRRSMDEVSDQLDRIRPVLTVLDPLYVSAGGGDGKSLYAMGEALVNLQLVATETTLHVTHHFNRDRGQSGIARISGAGPAEWGRYLVAADVKRRQRTAMGTDVLREFTVAGSGIPDQSYMVRREIMADRSILAVRTSVSEVENDWSDGRSPAQRRVLAVLEGPHQPLGTREIGDRLANDGTGPPLKKRTIQEALEVLTKDGLVDGDVPIGLPGKWWQVAP
jgi:hypothetical protein